LLRGYLSEGEAIGLPEVLVRLGAEAGLDVDELTATLMSDAHAREVREDEAEAAAIGIGGVPFFVFGGRYAVSGAQPPELLLEVLTRAWADGDARSAPPAEGNVCGPDGC
jgi:predicted DsbA family dithiol-disulfide isomerase